MLLEVFLDPEDMREKVAVVVALPGGATSVRAELNDDGLSFVIKYCWPKPLYHMEDLFKGPIREKQLMSYHPKILALKLALRKHCPVDSVPEGKIHVALPIPVQTGNESWTKYGVTREDGSHILVAEFTGLAKQKNLKLSDFVVGYEKQHYNNRFSH